MGKKRTPSRAAAPAAPPPPPGKSRTIAIAVTLIAVVAGAAIAVALLRGSSSTPQGDAAQTGTPATAPQPGQIPDAPPAAARFGPHTQATYPPLPTTSFPPPRSMEVVSGAYKFAAEHPEVLGYIPCFCGCDRQGHRGNDDCFVARRDSNGDVLEWDSHGMT